MNCKKVKNRLSLFLSDELSEKESKEITLHLEQCQLCQKELSELKATYELLNQVEPVIKFPYPTEDFLPQVRRKIRNRTLVAQKRSFLPKLIPAFSSAVMILIAVVLFNIYRTQEARKTVTITDTLTDENTVTGFMNNLDEDSQNLVAEQMINDISDSDFESFDSELTSSLETDELISNLTETEQEVFINQILTEYKEAQDKINPDWVESNPGGQNG